MSDLVQASIVTGGFGVVVAMIGYLAHTNKREHGQNSQKLDRIEEKLDEHIGDHARANINRKTTP